MRTIFNLTKYDKPSRLEYALNFSKFSEHITNQGLNIIFATIGMFHKARKRNKSRIDNYIKILKKFVKLKGPSLLEVRISNGALKNLSRPKNLIAIKNKFMIN